MNRDIIYKDCEGSNTLSAIGARGPGVEVCSVCSQQITPLIGGVSGYVPRHKRVDWEAMGADRALLAERVRHLEGRVNHLEKVRNKWVRVARDHGYTGPGPDDPSASAAVGRNTDD